MEKGKRDDWTKTRSRRTKSGRRQERKERRENTKIGRGIDWKHNTPPPTCPPTHRPINLSHLYTWPPKSVPHNLCLRMYDYRCVVYLKQRSTMYISTHDLPHATPRHVMGSQPTPHTDDFPYCDWVNGITTPGTPVESDPEN